MKAPHSHAGKFSFLPNDCELWTQNQLSHIAYVWNPLKKSGSHF